MTPLYPPRSSYSPTLVVDSNSAAANQLTEQLNHSGFHADVASSWPAAQVAARAVRLRCNRESENTTTPGTQNPVADGAQRATASGTTAQQHSLAVWPGVRWHV